MKNYNRRGRSCLISVGELQVEAFFQKWGIDGERTLDGKTISVTKGIVEIAETGQVTLVEPQTIRYTDLDEH